MIRIIRRFAAGFVLPLKGGLFLLRRRSLLTLALIPLVLNILLYTAAVVLVVRYYGVWFGLLFEQPQSWYLLVGYEVLHLLAFLLVLAVLLFSFVFVGTTLAAPFLELLSERVEQVLRGREAQPVQLHQWLIDLLRSLGHTLILLTIWLVTFPLNFLPVVGQATWLLGGWLLLAYNFASFALERRRWSFREQWRVLLRDWAAALGFGAAVFVLMMIPLVGLVMLPTAAVAGTMLVLDIEDRGDEDGPMIEDLWYKNAVIYNLDVGTFMDADGDGYGDFEGLVRRLDYLAGLGVTCLWLLPFQPTPDRDNGYDITDYYGVDPRHGSLGDFVEFMHQARGRGIRVIMDLVVNHTSDQHPWFKAARSDKRSPYRDWYLWSKKRPKNFQEGMVFPGVQETTWTYDKEAREYYFRRFYDFQPDLNAQNPAVQTEIRRIMGFWLELGVCGFRVDAVPFIIEAEGLGGKPSLQFDYLRELRRFLQWRCGDAILLGEANVLPPEHIRYFGEEDDHMHMLFNFFVNQHLFYALASGNVRPLVKALRSTHALPHSAQWGQFLRNQDELDLGRLTDEQRQTVFAQFGPEERMQLYHRGIRRRLAPMLGNRLQLELAYSLLFTLPGTPVIRYGDEIGMGDNLTLKERNPVRTPMQWSDEPHGGFSTAEKTTLPVIDTGVYAFGNVNVAVQRRDPESLLNWTERIIRMRKECPEIGWGTCKVLGTGSPHVLALRYDWRGNAVIAVHNFDKKPHSVTLTTGAEKNERLVNLLSEQHSVADERGKYHIPLEAFGYRWFRVGSLQYILRREKV